ncbi:MAG: type I-C CRISPR-associated protein Cas8c/Csd1 [Alicyclobacillus sp.]|nr:type I-C CRISPR-associated protein Cas8c/Csd1 [Alicyclobacillus sp.]
MILQALYRYYQILLEQEGASAVPTGNYSSADVAFEVHLNEVGHVVAITVDLDEKGKVRRQKYRVPRQDKRTSGVKPYFLCDKPEYLFGAALGMREECRQASRDLWREVLSYAAMSSPELDALQCFVGLESETLLSQLRTLTDETLVDLLKSGGLCVLKYAPTGRYLHADPSILRAWEAYCTAQDSIGGGAQGSVTCLVTGERIPWAKIARVHPNIKNVVGAQSSGAAVVSFNIESFCSYGRGQSYNAPTSQEAADGYGYALNRLLSDSKHKVRMNDTTVVFWAESSSEPEVDLLASLLADWQEGDESQRQDPDSVRERVRSAVRRVSHGQTFRETFADLDPSIAFYILGLSPNSARLSVRFWYMGTMGEIGERVWKHYEDLAIVGLDKSPSVRELLREVAVGRDTASIPSNMEGQLLRSVLLGLPYSRSIFVQLMNRIRSESDDPKKGLRKIGPIRAAMIKAYLLRAARTNPTMRKGEITMALDEHSSSTPYNLGRLFACLEKAQESALGHGLNATIRERFWGAASATPASVFPRLLSLAQHHVAKDEKWGNWNDRLIQQVMNSLPPALPRRLTLEEQGMFALGYYHQKQDFYARRPEEPTADHPGENMEAMNR